MAKDPTFPFYAQDFLCDTLSWSDRHIGIYTRMLCYFWINGYSSETELKKAIKNSQKILEKYPEKFITIKEKNETKYSSKRLEKERDKRIENRKKKVDAANTRWGNVH